MPQEIELGDQFEVPKDLGYQGCDRKHTCTSISVDNGITILGYMFRGLEYGVGEFQVRKILQEGPLADRAEHLSME